MTQSEQRHPYGMALKTGLLIAVVKILLSTVQYQFFAENMGATYAISLLSFIIGLILLYSLGLRQRKAMGGYIELKQVFQALFVSILIFVTLNFLYDLLYTQVIDPTLTDRIQESSMNFAEKMGAPQETLDKMAEEFEKQQTKSLEFGTISLSFFSLIVWYSIIGFIFAAIIKKRKPLTDIHN